MNSKLGILKEVTTCSYFQYCHGNLIGILVQSSSWAERWYSESFYLSRGRHKPQIFVSTFGWSWAILQAVVNMGCMAELKGPIAWPRDLLGGKLRYQFDWSWWIGLHLYDLSPPLMTIYTYVHYMDALFILVYWRLSKYHVERRWQLHWICVRLSPTAKSV